MKRKELGRIIYIAVAALLAAALLAATIAVAVPRKEAPAGTVDSEAFKERDNVRYPIEVSRKLSEYISVFQSNLVDGILLFFGFEPSGITLSGDLLAGLIEDFYSAAGIPAEKLLNFGELLASFSPYEIYTAGFDAVKFFVEITPITEEQAEETFVECSNCGELAEGEYEATETDAEDGYVYSCHACAEASREASVVLKYRYTSSPEWYCPVCGDYLGLPDMEEAESSGSEDETKKYTCKACGTLAESRLVSVAYASIDTFSARVAAADPMSLWRVFAKKTMLSTEETARLIYQAVYTLRGEEDREIMDSFGKTRFVNLLVSAVTVAEGISGFGSGGGSLIEARALAALVYEAGAALDEVMTDVGAAALLEAFGLKGYSASVDIADILEGEKIDAEALAAMEEFNEAMKAADTVTEFLLQTLTGALLASDTPMFDAMYYASHAATEAERGNYRDYYVLQTAKCLNAGLTRAFASDCGTDNAAEASEKLAAVFEKLSVLDPGNGACVEAAELKKLFDSAAEVSAIVAATAEDVSSLSAAERQKITDFGAFAEDLIGSGKLSGGLDAFASTFVANVVYDVIKAATDEVSNNQ